MFFQSSTIQYPTRVPGIEYRVGFFWKHFLRFFDFFQNRPQIFSPVEILSDKSSILPIAMKVGSKDAGESPTSFALLFVKNYAILDLSDKISTGGWRIPKYKYIVLHLHQLPYSTCHRRVQHDIFIYFLL